MRVEDGVYNILLVEDNPVDIDLTRRALQKSDLTIHLDIARDGEEAIGFVHQWDGGSSPPIFILLDLKLPKVEGLDVLKRLKGHVAYRIIPVIVLTSSNESKDIRNAYESGANSYILKSINYDEFTSAIFLIVRYWCTLNIHPE